LPNYESRHGGCPVDRGGFSKDNKKEVVTVKMIAGAIVILAGAVAYGAGVLKGGEAGMIAGLVPGIGLGLFGLVILHKG
jgi:hypothetical protein